MSERALHCPRCGNPMRQLTRRRDYFCRACESALSVVDEHTGLLQPDLAHGETLVSLEPLRQPPKREG